MATSMKNPASMTAAAPGGAKAEKSTDTRPRTHNANSAASGGPAIGSRPVQFGIAVNRNPVITAPAKPNNISWRCQASAPKLDEIVTKPSRASSQMARARIAQSAPPKKNGRKPPLRNGAVASIRARRSSSICSPRVFVTDTLPREKLSARRDGDGFRRSCAWHSSSRNHGRRWRLRADLLYRRRNGLRRRMIKR